MPGFNSFLLGRGHFKSFRPNTPPPAESDPEPEVLHKLLRRKARREAKQVTTIYNMTMSRDDVKSIHHALKRLQADVELQIEAFHDAGILDPKSRPRIMHKFRLGNSAILHDAAAILQRLDTTTGPLADFQTGLSDLARITGTQRVGDKTLEWEAAGEIVGVYRAGIVKPLGKMVRVFGKAMAREGGWRDRE